MLIEDGIVRFALVVDGAEKPFEIDSLVATTLADGLVARHGLATTSSGNGDVYVLTPDFRSDLGHAFAAQFSLPATSSTVAMKLWMAAQREVYGLKKNTSERQGSRGTTESTPSS